MNISEINSFIIVDSNKKHLVSILFPHSRIREFDLERGSSELVKFNKASRPNESNNSSDQSKNLETPRGAQMEAAPEPDPKVTGGGCKGKQNFVWEKLKITFKIKNSS